MRNTTLILCSLSFVLCATAAAADPFVGTWKMDPARSSVIAPKSETYVVTLADSGAVTLTKDYVGSSGASHHNTTKCKLDGKDYPVTGHQLPGATRAVKRIDPHTWQVTLKSAGKLVNETREVVSDDGNTLTVTGIVTGAFATDGQTHDIKTIYTRQ